MSVFFAFYVSGGTFWGRNCLNKIFFSHFFSSRKLFRFLGKFFRQGCKVSSLCDWRRFLMKWFFERTVCLYNCFQKLSGRFLNFCLVFWQRCSNCIPCVRRNIPRKSFLSKKSQLCFRILIHKNLILRNNSACS